MDRKEIEELADRTADAYSYEDYGRDEWVKCIAFLSGKGFSARETEDILRSKVMRWVKEEADGEASFSALETYSLTPNGTEALEGFKLSQIQGESGLKAQDTQFEALKERLNRRHIPSRISVVKENPGPGELTVNELSSLDPGSSPKNGDYASAALITSMCNDGRFSKLAFIYDLAEVDPEDEASHADDSIARASATVERMLEAGLLEIRDGRVFTNTELLRR